MLKRLWREDEGVLTFEWIMLLTLLVIGVVGGVAGVRDATIQTCQNVAGALVSWNPSYDVGHPLGLNVPALGVTSESATDCTSGAAAFAYAAPQSYINVGRTTGKIASPISNPSGAEQAEASIGSSLCALY